MGSSAPVWALMAKANTCPGDSPWEANRNFRSGLAARYEVRPAIDIRLFSVREPAVASNA